MILVDSGAFIALAVPEDARHQLARSFIQTCDETFCVLNSILSETYTHLRYRFGSSAATGFLDAVSALRSAHRLRIDYVDANLSGVAEAILRQYADIKLSYVDATALAWLRAQAGVTGVFGFDEHWRIEGHILLPSSGK